MLGLLMRVLQKIPVRPLGPEYRILEQDGQRAADGNQRRLEIMRDRIEQRRLQFLCLQRNLGAQLLLFGVGGKRPDDEPDEQESDKTKEKSDLRLRVVDGEF